MPSFNFVLGELKLRHVNKPIPIQVWQFIEAKKAKCSTNQHVGINLTNVTCVLVCITCCWPPVADGTAWII